MFISSTPIIDFVEHNLSPAITLLLCFVLSLSLVVFSIPGIILVALRKRLLDKPDYRKKHKKVTSNFGGLAIYSATIFVASFFGIGKYLPEWDYIFAGSFMLFITGLKDDVLAITFKQKFIVQFVAAFIVVYFAHIRLDNMYGFMGINELHPALSIIISTIGITFVTNAYNLIDGIDGLCGTLSFVETFLFGLYFAKTGNTGIAILSFTLAGAISGFLYYNISPARIFMGDTGSLVIGFILSILCILMVRQAPVAIHGIDAHYFKVSGITLAFATCLIPIFDTARVFTTRILHKQPPFRPDRRHIHHLLSDAGCGANKTVFILAASNIGLIVLTIFLLKMHLSLSVVVLLLLFVCLGLLLVTLKFRNTAMARRKNKKYQSGSNQVTQLASQA